MSLISLLIHQERLKAIMAVVRGLSVCTIRYNIA